MKKHIVIAFLTAAVGSALVTAAPLCWGKFARLHAVSCFVENSEVIQYDSNLHMFANPGFGPLAICPFNDTDAFPKESATKVTFYFYSTHSFAQSALDVVMCDTYATSAGGTCGPANPSTGTVGGGAFTVSLAPSSSWSHNGFGYSVVSWDPPATSAGLTFAGYKVMDDAD